MKKTRILSAALVLVILLSMLCACSDNAANAVKVNFTLTVTHADGSEKEFEISTEETNLRKALEAEGIIAGDESEYGLFVLTVDGETVDYSKNQSWWCLTQNGEMTTTGVDSITVSEGDSYGFVYTIGY